jgi:excisionase family DNA binding protein
MEESSRMIKDAPDPRKLLTQHEVCRILGVSPSTLQHLRRDRKISFLQFGHRSIRFREEAVLAFMRQREVNS